MTIKEINTNYPPSKYSVHYDCANCGWSGDIKINKGTLAPITKTCPICECGAATKSVAWLAQVRKEPYVVEKDPTTPLIWPRKDPRQQNTEKGCPICARKDGTVHGCMPPRITGN